MFIDHAKIYVKAGNGGSGVSSFRREKYVPFGGPNGGDGGNGGNVVFQASHRSTTLLDLKYLNHFEAKNGRPGATSNKHGRNGADVTVTVPVGTIIKDFDTQDVLVDLVEDGQIAVIARGGKGGRGNARFATSTNRAPTKFETGTPGEEFTLQLELKLLADVGLVGYPNAGKSTLISTLSAARPEIADYPFTTLKPNLGVVQLGDYRSFVMADIPGLIEGAHTGKGLGIQFLKHIQRTAFLLYLIDISEWAPEDPVEALEVLRRELATFDEHLGERPYAIIGTKLDLKGDGSHVVKLQEYCEKHQLPFFTISSATREGIDALVPYIGSRLDEIKDTCNVS
ncbi:GTPase ObgE [Candidatus Nitronereus thalassa]|uniref:GTPase Obg n=1 Tax=Candidatus Nitronereus thalassa TaxID=3020898 RepID=A0ABU3KAR4_9BACT|nr:GTPase ObgE [Candidatus Nitronereus thalassa]MDT7043489.1 GTPase ObgE [Candidatus Nitronereus thalassa]